MNELSRHHYDVWKAWDDKIRGNAINEHDILDLAPLHQEEFYEITSTGMLAPLIMENPDDTFYVKASKNNKNYIIPTRFLKDLPLEPKETIRVQLKKSDTKVYEFVTERVSFTIPMKLIAKNEDIKSFFEDEFNPIPHDNPKHAMILKLISFCQQLKLGICSEVGGGKNSNQIILKSMLGGYEIIEECSKPMLWYTMKSKSYIVCDEITNWKDEFISNIESISGAVADEKPDIPKSALGRGLSLENMNASELSFIFTYNRPCDLNQRKKTVKPFEQKWDNPARIQDRYPCLLFTGKSIGQVGKINMNEAKGLMEKHFKDMNMTAARAKYVKDNYHIHMHHWSRSKIQFERRHLANINSLLDMIDVISLTQAEFDGWLDVLHKCRDEYKKMIGMTRLLKATVKEEEEEQQVWDFTKS